MDVGSRAKAVRYWHLAIGKATRLGAAVELAHTLVDAGELLGSTAPGMEWRDRGAKMCARLGIGEDG